MTLSFLILIAVPLCIYLLVILYATRHVGTSRASDATARDTSAVRSPSPVGAADEKSADTSAIVESSTDQAASMNPAIVKKVERGKANEKVKLAAEGAPKYIFDYRGRLWVEKKNRGFFRQLRRPQLPPDEPNGS